MIIIIITILKKRNNDQIKKFFLLGENPMKPLSSSFGLFGCTLLLYSITHTTDRQWETVRDSERQWESEKNFFSLILWSTDKKLLPVVGDCHHVINSFFDVLITSYTILYTHNHNDNDTIILFLPHPLNNIRLVYLWSFIVIKWLIQLILVLSPSYDYLSIYLLYLQLPDK